MNRRMFLQKFGTAVLAMRFGEALASSSVNLKGDTLIIYATRYGATRDTAGWIAEGMRSKNRTAELLDFAGLGKASNMAKQESASNILVGSGIWTEGPDLKLINYLKQNSQSLAPKIRGTFIVCGTPSNTDSGRKRISTYFEKFHQPLPQVPAYYAAFGGRMDVEKLSETDREKLTRFYKKLGRELKSWDRTQPALAKAFADKISI